MITDRKEVISIVKEALNPLYKQHRLNHDDFKTVAKEATNTILAAGQGATVVEIKTKTFRTVLALQNSISLGSDGIAFAQQQLGGGGGDDAGQTDPATAGGDKMSSSTQVVPGDEQVTLEKFKAFMSGIRAKQQEAAEDAAGRRQRTE